MSELDSRFKIRAPLRCDGIGRLDCAEDSVSGRRLAVRWLPVEANGAAAVLACEKLPEHPTLPRIHTTGTVGGSAFVALDFPEGKLLSALIGDAIEVEKLLSFGAQIADALAMIHGQNVFHGELSPESILTVPSERAYLWDMPLVIANRLTDRRGEERLMHQLVRTAAYLSPERARGGAATPESDVYSLGAVLCIGAGSPKPSESTTLGIVHAISTGAWSPLVPTRYPEALKGMVARMVARNPAERPTAREVADALGRPFASMPTLPEMPAVFMPELSRAKGALPEVVALNVPEGISGQVPQLSLPKPAVVINSGVSVDASMAKDVVSLSNEEVAQLETLPKSRTPFFIAGGIVAVLLLGLTAVISAYSRPQVSSGTPAVLPPPSAQVAPAVPSPEVQAPVVDVAAPTLEVAAAPSLSVASVDALAADEDFAPLPATARKAPAASRKSTKRSAAAAVSTVTTPEVVAPAPEPASDNELKRPQF